MPRGEKSKYTDKQERKADHIAEGYEKRGVGKKEAERRAWATSTRMTAAARTPVDQEGASTRDTLLPTRADVLAAKLPLRAPHPPASAKKAAATRKRRGH
jgi:plasmid stabilization system protein ParE